jgi:hypothetical protein
LVLWHLFLLTILFGFCGGLYFLPAIIAFARHHQNKVPIALVNLFFGWSGLGWIVALIWTFTSPAPSQVVVIQQPPPSAQK